MTPPKPRPKLAIPHGLSPLTLLWVAKQHDEAADEVLRELRRARRAIIAVASIYQCQDRAKWHRAMARKLRGFAGEIATRAEKAAKRGGR